MTVAEPESLHVGRLEADISSHASLLPTHARSFLDECSHHICNQYSNI